MAENCNILIVDDNKSILTALKMLLNSKYSTVTTTTNPNAMPDLLRKNKIDLVLLDMNFTAGINNGNEGLYWLKEILKINSDISVIMITAYGDVQLAVDALKIGAVDFVLKPWDNEKLLATVSSACKFSLSRKEVEGLKQKEEILKKEFNENSKFIIGTSSPILSVLKTIKKVANTDANILITGENGTGKELIAREIHRLSKRSNELMVTVDMGAISETLFESELFGHKKGAFTDAREDRAGKFESANKGTLFLDELGNLPLAMQAKLLVALQKREIIRIGENTPRNIDIRLISATNQNLPEKIQQGYFREDLLYRINTIQIEIPPLRERGNDIILLAEFFLSKYCSKYGKRGMSISATGKKELLHYSWPGNVRELQHVIEKAVILSDNTELNEHDFYLDNSSSTESPIGIKTIEEMELTMIKNAIKKNDGNMSATANQLGITRQTLYNKMKKHEL